MMTFGERREVPTTGQCLRPVITIAPFLPVHQDPLPPEPSCSNAGRPPAMAFMLQTSMAYFQFQEKFIFKERRYILPPVISFFEHLQITQTTS